MDVAMKKKKLPTCCFAFLAVEPAVADEGKTRLCEIVLERLIFESHLAVAVARHDPGLRVLSAETGIPTEVLISDEVDGYLAQGQNETDLLGHLGGHSTLTLLQRANQIVKQIAAMHRYLPLAVTRCGH